MNPFCDANGELDELFPSHAETRGGAGELTADAIDALLLVGRDRKALAETKLRAGLVNNYIRNCPDCGGGLNLPALEAGRPTETWRCSACGAVCLSGPTDERAPDAGAATRAHRDSRVPVDQLPACQPAALRMLLKELCSAEYVGEERRAYPRYPASLPAMGVPLDTTRRVTGPCLRVTTRDISGGGLSGFTEAEFESPFLLVDFTPAGRLGWQVCVEVQRRRPAGVWFEFGGAFATP